MARKLPDTVYLVTGNNHKAERVVYGVYVKEENARFRRDVSLTLNPNTEAEYKPIKKEDIPRGWKSKVQWK